MNATEQVRDCTVATAQRRLDVAASRGLARLLDEAAAAIDGPSASQAKILERLNALRDRLATERFQLAVLGQFKRGKSTVLNALLGQSVLPIGVVPVTAIPTFLEPAGAFKVRVAYVSDKVEEFEPNSTEAMREKLTAFVTEGANPRNVLNVARVDVFLPAELLERGVVLIDTPGVGSTHRHQTAAADAILPECDTALLVVSVDPPITEIEIEYLARIRQTVARLIVVLNKIDAIEPHEREKAASFLRNALVDHAGLDPFTPIFSLSARDALRAKNLAMLKRSPPVDSPNWKSIWCNSWQAKSAKHLTQPLREKPQRWSRNSSWRPKSRLGRCACRWKISSGGWALSMKRQSNSK